MGDPAGIGPEVLLSALESAPHVPLKVVGDLKWLKGLSRRLHLSIPWNRIEVCDVPNLPARFLQGKIQPFAGRAAFEYLEVALAQLKRDPTQALVTAPVSKQAIVRAGIPWVGHTEYLGSAFRVKPLMMFVTGTFRVALVTTHLALREASSYLTKDRLVPTLRLLRESLVRDFGIRRPRLGVAAFNPHAGEGGFFGNEEQRILKPAVRAAGRDVKGPVPADNLMALAAAGQYDAVVALYHDQALIAVKLIGWNRAVNVTLGLPFVRTSPVHGTAFDLVGRGRPDAGSMRAAIELAIQLSHRRNERSGH